MATSTPRVFLSSSNSKLEKTAKALARRIVAFNLPPDTSFTVKGKKHNTCPGADKCRRDCYAKQGRFTMPAAMNVRRENLAATLHPQFVKLFLAELDAAKADTVRVHDSGDFYRQEYLESFFEIARNRPHVLFYCYTKSLHLDWSQTPTNFRVVQSMGGKYDSDIDPDFPHSRIFATHAEREAAGYIDGNVNDGPAINGLVQIGLVYHGTRRMSDGLAAYLAAA